MFAVATTHAPRGKYDIAFAFRVRRGIAASLFSVEPSKGVVGPGEAAEVCVTFCSREETHLKVTDVCERTPSLEPVVFVIHFVLYEVLFWRQKRCKRAAASL